MLFDEKLRRQTVEAAERLHQLLASNIAPAPVVHPKCRECSLNSLCLPDLVVAQSRYQRAVRDLYSLPMTS